MPYDVFLSHNSKDKPFVRAVAEWFGRHGVNHFLDENDLEPGDRLTDVLGAAMEESQSAIVFIGPHGEGPWMREEVDSLLSRAIKLSRQKDEFRIIPVLLPNADTTKLRWFLQTRLWVDLSKGVTDNEAELFRLRQAILGRADGSAIAGDADFNPYMGLSAFQFKDSDFFFGRAKACRDLAAKLKEWRFACVVGPSGNGKSSLARAGLGTDAAEDAFPGIHSFKRVTLVPGANLLRAFVVQLAAGLPDAERADRVARAMDRIDPKGQNSSASEWADRLNDELRAWFPDPQQCVLFLVDQFEEVFTHRGLVTTTDAEREERIRKLLECLAVLATQGDKRWHFVFTFRNDFYQRCRVSPSFWKLVSADRLNFPLDELDEEGWREAIKGPAARAGAYLQAGLVETMLKDVYRQRGSMPLLQLALHQLWRFRQGACLTHAAYTALGGVSNALQVRAESALKHLRDENPEYLEIARNLFLRLTALGEGVSDSRRRLDRSELDWENTDPQAVEHVLAELSNADNRLLVADAHSVEVTHEVLIRECDSIRGWVEAARKEIPVLRRLTHASRRWEEKQRAPVFLNAADPPRELKQWATHTTLRLTRLERQYWEASRAQRAKDLRQKHAQAQALLRSEQEKRVQAQALLRFEQEKRAQAQALLLSEQEKSAQAGDLLRAEQKMRAAAEVHAKAQEHLRRKAKRVARVAFAFAIAAIASTVIAGYKWLQASDATATAQTALVRATNATLETQQSLEREKAASVAAQQALTCSFIRTIGTSKEWSTIGTSKEWSTIGTSKEWTPSGDEAEALWELAALERANEPVRKAVLTNWVQTPDLIVRALAHDASGLHSAIGLNASLMTDYPSWASTAATLLADALENPQEQNSDRLFSFGEALAALAGRMNATNAAPVAERIAKALENSQEKDSDRLHRLGEVLAVLTGRMDATNAAPVAERGAVVLARALENTQEQGFDRLSGLGGALAALAGRMNATNAAPVAERGAVVLAKALENPQGKISFRLPRLGGALAALVGWMDATNAAPVAERIVKALENPQEKDFDRLSSLGEVLAALAGRMDATNAAPVAERIAKALENPQEKDSFRLSRLGEALAVLIGRMDATNAAPVAERGAVVLARALENTQEQGFDRLYGLGTALAALAGRMNATNAAPVAERIAKALENPQEKDSFRL
ncbi:MAG: TIR domain-containing protein, partial [Verrucomicrobiota bacterium]